MSEILRKGTLVYELDEDGVNRWSFDVQPGVGLDGFRQPNSVIERIARDMQTRYSYHNQLVEALREVLPDIASSEVCGHMLRYDGVKDLLTKLEQQQ